MVTEIDVVEKMWDYTVYVQLITLYKEDNIYWRSTVATFCTFFYHLFRTSIMRLTG